MPCRRVTVALLVFVLLGVGNLPVSDPSLAGADGSVIEPLSMPPSWTDPLDDTSHVYFPPGGLIGIEVLGGDAHLEIGAIDGWLASEVISPPEGYRYDRVLLEVDTPGGSYFQVSVLDATREASGVGFANETISNFELLGKADLSVYSIDPVLFPELRIQVNLYASGPDRPRLLSWTLLFIDLEEWRDDFLSTSKMGSAKGLNVTAGEVTLNLSRKSMMGGSEYDPFPPLLLANNWYMANGGLDAFFSNAQGTGYNDKTTIPGKGVHGVGIDDLNGDGYLDLVCANYGTSSGSDSQIYWGSSSGTWSDTGAKTLSTRWGRNAETGDFNGDGERDFVIAASRQTGSTDSYVYLNKGSGTFNAQADVRISTAMSYEVGVGDLDKDGYDDIVFGEQGTSRCYLGGPSGPSTTPSESYASNGLTYDVLVYDLDLDGNMDIVFTNSDSSSAPVYMGGPDGPDTTADFTLGVSSARSTGVTAGDVNGDGYVDIVFSYSTYIKIYPGASSGWSDSTSRTLTTAQLCQGVECLDLDKDGYGDIMTTSSGSGSEKLEIFRGRSTWPTGADITKDGGSYAYSIGVAVPKGGASGYTGTLVTEPITVPLNKKWDLLYLDATIPEGTTVTMTLLDSGNESITGHEDITETDVDISGLDTSLHRTVRVKVTLASETNTTTPTLDLLLVRWMDPMAWRDEFYGMAKVERRVNTEVSEGALVGAKVWYAEGPQQILVTSTRGDEGYDTNPVLHTLTSRAGTVTFDVVGTSAADAAWVNSDHLTDVVFAVYRTKDGYRNSSPLFLGHTTGFWPDPDFEFPTVGATDVELRDINRDGHVDVIFAQEYDGTTYAVNSTLFWGNDEGWNSTPDIEFVTVGASSVVAEDLDGDGDTDLVFSCWRDDFTTSVDSMVFLQKAGTFSGASPDYRLPTHGARGVDAGNIDGDRILDVVFANNFHGGSVEVDSYVYWGKEGGGFETTPTGLRTSGAEDVKLVCWKDDPTPLDIVFANNKDNQEHYSVDSYIYLTDGSRTFNSTPDVRLPTTGARAVDKFTIDDVGGDQAVVFACQYNGTSYIVPSLVYYEFRPGEPTELPTVGASGLFTGGIMPMDHAAYMSRPITPENLDEAGGFHTFRYTATLTSEVEGTASLIDATTWETLAETSISSGTHEWVVDGLFSLRDHPSVRVVIACYPIYGSDSLHLDDLWLNWTKRVKLPPRVVDLSVSGPSVYRLQTVTLRVEVADEYDLPGDLMLNVEHRLNGTDTWGRYLLGTPTYSEEEGAWLYTITPKTGAAVGIYDFHVDVTDTDMLYVDNVEFPAVLEVLNNLPTAPVVHIAPSTPSTTSQLRVEFDTRSTDLETTGLEYRFLWSRDGVPVANLTGDLVPSFHTTKGENWSVEVRAWDGDDESEPALAWVLIGNAAPSVDLVLPDPDLDEDTVDSDWLDLSTAFKDDDGDVLTWSLASVPEHLEVTIDPVTGKVTLSPEQDWYGQVDLTFVASDGEATATQTVTVTVNPINDLPVITTVDGKPVTSDSIVYTIKQGDVLTISFDVVDIEDDAVRAMVNTTAVVLDEAAHTITFSPGSEAVGTLRFGLWISDDPSVSRQVGLNFVIVVENENDPMEDPVITSPWSGERFKANKSFGLLADCFDPDVQFGQVLNFTWESNVSGVLGYGPSLTVKIAQPGRHRITVTVRDPDFSKSVYVDIVIEPEGEVVPPPPPDDDDGVTGLNWLLVVVIVAVIVVLGTVLFLVGTRRRAERIEAEEEAVFDAEVKKEALERTRDALKDVADKWEAESKAAAAGWEAVEEERGGMEVDGAMGGQLSMEARVTEGPSEDVAKLWVGVSGATTAQSEEEREALRVENLKRKYQNAIGRLPYGIPSKELQGMDWVALASALATGERKLVEGGKEVTLIDGRWYYSDHEDTGTFLKEHGAKREEPKKKAEPATGNAALLAKLEERFILGEITEESYLELKEKYKES